MTVAKTKSAKLKLYTEDTPKPVRPPLEAVGSLPDVLRAFAQTTGWSLSYLPLDSECPASDKKSRGFEKKSRADKKGDLKSAASSGANQKNDLSWAAPVNPGVGTPLGQLRLDPLDSPDAATRLAPEPVRALASSLADMLSELLHTRHALWQREAELAAGVPLVPQPQQSKHLAERLEAVLRGGAMALDCQAAALYLLDDATSQLKLRSCWGLPLDRLAAPPRPLQGSIADIEALLGHAVVLEDSDVMRHWRVPEDFPAAVCVPVSTPTMILGTLWVFSDRKRDFNDRQTNILEIVAGRVASDLEREMLIGEGLAADGLKKQLDAAERLQSNQLPTISPLLDGWQLAGWTAQADALGGDFHDWFCLPDGLLAVAAGHALSHGVEAALAAVAMKAGLRAHGQYCREAQPALKRLNLTMWTGSAGDQHGTLFYGLIQTAAGQVCCASAGQPGVVLVRQDGWESLGCVAPQLGESPESDFESYGCQLQPGEALVIFTEGVRDATDAQGCPLGEAGVAQAVLGRLDLSADELAALVRGRLDSFAVAPERFDRTVLVIKRQPIA